MEWLRRNVLLAVGVGLPLALIIFFACAKWIPTLFVAFPKYDILYLANEYGSGVRFTVKDKRVAFTFSGTDCTYNSPKLYRYSPTSGELKTISLPMLENLQNTHCENPQNRKRVMPIVVPEVQSLIIDPSPTAPDGYMFRVGHGTSFGLAEVFLLLPSYHHSSATLVKNGRVINVPRDESVYHIQFIGWIVQ